MRILASLSLALALAVPNVARAEVPQPGQWIEVATVLCDTHEQVASIVRAAQEADSFEAAAKRFEALYRTVNDKGEPTCAAGTISGAVLDVRPLGAAPGPRGQLLELFAVGLENAYGSGVILWSEPIASRGA